MMDTIYRSAPPWLQARTILLTRSGSHAYGLATDESDLDVRGVAIAPLPYYVGFSRRFERYTFEGSTEGEVEDIRVFMRAACNGEPQVLPVLFCDASDVLHTTRAGDMLRATRDVFLSQRLVRPFTGHASSIVIRHERFGRITPKEAMTAVRLVRMLAEILVAGKVVVRRHDADELLAIRRGERSIEDALKEARDGLSRVDAWKAKTALREQPDLHALDGLCTALVMGENGVTL